MNLPVFTAQATLYRARNHYRSSGAEFGGSIPAQSVGFTAEASLYKTNGRYHMAGVHRQINGAVYPAYLDQDCYDSCYGDCVHECFNLTGWPKSACVRYGYREAQECRKACDVASPLPPPSCPPGLSLCGTICTNLTTDPMNCGACGISCGPGGTCCGGTCTDLSNDPMNCGACGTPCSPGGTCCGGTCCSQCCYGGTCGVTVTCPTSGTSCCPSGFPVCRSFFGNEFCSPF